MKAKQIPEDEVIERYGAGESTVSIARSLSVGTQRIGFLLKERGLLRTRSEALKIVSSKRTPEQKRNLRRKGRKLDIQEILALFNSGLNPSRIAAKLRVNHNRIRKVIISAGLLMPPIPVRICASIGCMNELIGHKAAKICKTCAPNMRFANLIAKYGVSKPIWDEMEKRQNGRCALCPKPLQFVDHCHKTGIVRGLLCPLCNTALACIEADSSWASRAVEYIQRDHGSSIAQ